MSKKERARAAASQLSHLQRMKLVKNIHQMWKDEEEVTLETICNWARYEIGFLKSKSQMSYILKGLGFCWKLKDHNTIIEERPDIVAKRGKFLEKMKELEEKGTFFGSYDETWSHEGMSTRRAWQHRMRICTREPVWPI
uniref:Winged helix-turn helix domain-containing protein n=2 Tax=Caenorhabditis japonica TaxID=281687 RepID=A0A8R1ERV3_CAEJA